MRTKQLSLQLFAALLFALILLMLRAVNVPTTPVAAQGTPTPTGPPGCVRTLFREGFEDGTLGAFISVVAACAPGGCGWDAVSTASHTGTYSAFSPDVGGTADQQLTLASPIAIPSTGLVTATLTFWHRFRFEGAGSAYLDGGVLETSINGGASWQPTTGNITSGGYNGTISGSFGNPLAGRPAWGQTSPAYPSFNRVTVNLLSFAGKNLLFRFRQGDDSSIASEGWWVDDVLVSIATAKCYDYLPLVMRPNGGPSKPSGSDPASSTNDSWHIFLDRLGMWFGRE